jgi:hypothetical protein
MLLQLQCLFLINHKARNTYSEWRCRATHFHPGTGRGWVGKFTAMSLSPRGRTNGYEARCDRVAAWIRSRVEKPLPLYGILTFPNLQRNHYIDRFTPTPKGREESESQANIKCFKITFFLEMLRNIRNKCNCIFNVQDKIRTGYLLNISWIWDSKKYQMGGIVAGRLPPIRKETSQELSQKNLLIIVHI